MSNRQLKQHFADLERWVMLVAALLLGLSFAVSKWLGADHPTFQRATAVLALCGSVVMPLLRLMVDVFAARSAMGHPAGRSAATLLSFLSLVVSQRIANEEIGDALEIIHEMGKAQRSRWAIYRKVATTVFWVCLHTAMEKVMGAVRLAMGHRDDRR